MTLEELIAQCQVALHSPLSTGDIILTVPRKSRAGEQIRLAGIHGGPMGTVLDDVSGRCSNRNTNNKVDAHMSTMTITGFSGNATLNTRWTITYEFWKRTNILLEKKLGLPYIVCWNMLMEYLVEHPDEWLNDEYFIWPVLAAQEYVERIRSNG